MKAATPKTLSILCGMIVFGIALLVLGGWFFNLPFFIRVHPQFAPTKVNTAIGLILASVSLVLLTSERRGVPCVVARICAVMVLAMGLATLAERLLGMDLGMNRLSAWAAAVPSGSRGMSPTTAFCLVCLGIALLALNGTAWRINLAEIATVAMLLAALARLAAQLYGVGMVVRGGLAIPTVISFTLLGVGILTARPDQGILALFAGKTAGAVLARRLLLAAIILPLSLGWLRVRGQQLGYFELPFGTAVFAVSLVVIFVGLIWWTAVSLDRSDQRRAQVEGRLAEQARLLDLTSDAMIVCDPSDRIVYWNKGAEEMYRFGRDEALGKIIRELLQTEFPEPLQLILEKLRRDKRWSGELRHTRRDGSQIVTFSRWMLNQEKETGREFIFKTNTDITEHKQAEARLRESEAQFRALFENAPLGTYLIESGTERIVDCNQRAAQMLGYTRDELRRMSVDDVDAGSKESVAAVRRQLVEGAPTRVFDRQHRTKSGALRDVLITSTPVTINDRVYKLAAALDITERKQAEARLQESEARFRVLFENAPLGTFVIESDTERIVDCNERAAQSLGYTRQELCQLRVPDIDAGLRPGESGRMNRRITHQGASLLVDTRHRTKSGDIRDVLITAAPITMNGQVYNFAAALDITARRRAEEALRESEERFRVMADNIPQLAWMTHPDGWIFWYNRRWFDYTGTTLEQMQGWGWQSVHHPDHVENVRAAFKRALETGQPWEDTFPLRGKDGQYRWFLSRAFPIRDANGNIIRWFGTNTDITELREAQSALAEREAVLRTVTDEARVGLIMLNRERRYMFANQVFAEFFGLKDAQIVGKRVPDLFPHIYDQIEPVLNRALLGERVSYELRLPAHPVTGGERFYEVVDAPRITETGEAYVVVVFIDITERKKNQQTLERLVEERTGKLRETVQELEAFSYSIAHDMRAPLRAMQSFAHIFIDDFGHLVPEQGRKYLERIRASAMRLDELIQDVLNYSKVTRGEIQLTPVNTEALLRQIIESYPNLQRPDVRIDIVRPLPVVEANPAALTQVFSNLLGNAVKFVKPGESPRVRIWADAGTFPSGNGAQLVRIWIEDNGIGIEPSSHERIFGMFQRLNRPELYEGTGVGLTIVRKAVERMGGRIGLESERGKGSRFWVELKAAGKEQRYDTTSNLAGRG